ncbi:MAG: hypothetical protein DRP18_05575, partial [Candidatus Aenigmatarchaeota archaeon]
MKQNIIEGGIIGIIVVLAIIIMFFAFLHFQRSNLTISLNSPIDRPTTNNLTVDFQFTVVGDEVVNCSLWTNETGSWSKTVDNQTAISNTTINTITYTFSSDGSYLWNIQCWNSTGDYDFADSNWTVTIDTATPNLTFYQPANNSNWVIRQKINISVYADESVGECILNFNGTNKTVTSSGQYCNTTIYPIATGYYSLTMYVSDSAGNWNSTTNYINLTKIYTGWKTEKIGEVSEGTHWFRSQMIIGDADNDGENELVAGLNNGDLYIFNWNGTGLENRLIVSTGYDIISSSVAITDIEDDEKNDLFFYTGGSSTSKTYIYELNATSVVRNVSYTPSLAGNYGHGSQPCGYVSNDNITKCVVGYCGGTYYGKVLIHHSNYTSQSTFEIDDYRTKYDDSAEGSLVCDCDNDGQIEVYSWNGFDESTTEHIWKYNITTDNQVESSVDYIQLTGFDLAGRCADFCGNDYNDLFIVDTLHHVCQPPYTGNATFYLFINGSNSTENRWKIYEDDGTLGDMGFYAFSFAYGDIDDDGKIEAVFGATGHRTGFSGNASVFIIDDIDCESRTATIRKLADYKGLGKSAYVSVGDIDDDGKEEIVVGVGNNDTTNKTSFYILEQISAGDTTPPTFSNWQQNPPDL